MLGVWALYAFAGAGLLPAAGVVHVPFLRPVLLLIAAVFLARGVLGIPLVLVVAESAPPQPLPQTIYAYAHELRGRMLFMTVSSAICLGLGVCYAAGALRLRVAP